MKMQPEEILFGKLPPQAKELEEAVIGACLIEQQSLAIAIELLQPECFYMPSHQYIFESITLLFAKGQPIDILTVAEKLKAMGKLEQVGGFHYLATVTSKIASGANTEHHAHIIIEKYLARELIKLSSEAINASYSPETDILEQLDDMSIKVLNLRGKNIKNKPVHIEQVANDNMAEIKLKSKSDNKQIGIQTGIKAIDDILVGLQPYLYIIGARPGGGKCLAKGTKVLMYNGHVKNVEDVVNGEYVMGDDSTPRLVSGVTVGSEEMFEIIPIKGQSFTVNKSHILSLRMSSNNGNVYKKGQIINISVEDYLNQNQKFKHHAKLWRTGVDFDDRNVDVSPYLYGLWIGDGNKRDVRITNCDKEVTDYLKTISSSVYSDKRNGVTTFGGFKNKYFRELVKNSIVEGKKTIKKEYLINSREKRLELLAGIIDTDGYLSNNCFEVVTKYDALKDDILFLCRSLGLAAYYSDKVGTIKSTNFKGNYYRLVISGNIDEIPCRIKRRKAEKRKQVKDVLNVGFKVESKGIGEYFGFAVDKNNLFLLGDFTVTHNTGLVCSLINNISIENLTSCAFFSLEMSKESIELRLKTIRTGISYSRLLKGEIYENEWERLYEETEVIAGSPIFIDDASGINIVDLRSKIINLVSKFGVKIVFVDYIQRMTSAEKGQKDTRIIINEISAGLARIAKDLKIPIVALSQLGRSVESTKDKIPELQHLKESGNLEEDAYAVLFIYRPEYYGLPTFTEKNSDVEAKDKAQIFIAKHKNGKLGDPIITFEKEKMLFKDIESGFTQFPVKTTFPRGKEDDFTYF